METLTFTVNKTDISLENYTMPTPAIPGGCSDVFCTFEFSDDWAGLTKKATFHNISSDYTKNALLSENGCYIPLSVLTYGNIEIGVVGLDGETIVKSVEPLRMPVKRSSYEHAENMPDIEPALIDQLLAKMAECDKGVVSGGVDPTDHHLYINLTNGDRIDLGEMATGSEGKQLDDIYVDDNGNIVIRYADGTEKTSSAAGLPPVEDGDLNKVAQIGQDGWSKQPLELDDSVVHVLTNLEIEELLNNFV